jgi:hypothetical protein
LQPRGMSSRVNGNETLVSMSYKTNTGFSFLDMARALVCCCAFALQFLCGATGNQQCAFRNAWVQDEQTIFAFAGRRVCGARRRRPHHTDVCITLHCRPCLCRIVLLAYAYSNVGCMFGSILGPTNCLVTNIGITLQQFSSTRRPQALVA